MRFSTEERMHDMRSLLSAATPDELHNALVLWQPAASEREPLFALSLLRKLHTERPGGVATTFSLLVTDPRYKSIGLPLVESLEASGLIPDETLDMFAELWVRADAEVYWECPEHWFDEGTDIVLSDPVGDELNVDVDIDAIDTETVQTAAGPAVVARRVPDAARRWGARRMVQNQPERWSAVYKRSTTATKPIGAALLHGLLDAAPSFSEETGNFLEAQALRSGNSGVRFEALKRRAQRDPKSARDLALTDGNARIRGRADSLVAQQAQPDEGEPPESQIDDQQEQSLF